MTIVKIHGCSGSGKTTMVRELMARASGMVVTRAPNGVPAYELDLPELSCLTYVLGSYENNCGGTDTIGNAQSVMDMIDHFHRKGNVVFEGLLSSTYYGAMGEHSKQFGHEYIYAFLQTPLAQCQENVILRREKNKTTRAYNPQLNVAKHATIDRLRLKLLNAEVHVVAPLYNVDQLIGMLE